MDYVRMNLRVGRTTKQAIADIAEEYGMSQNALVCYILGQYVSNHRRVLQGLPEKLQRLLVDEVQRTQRRGVWEEPECFSWLYPGAGC
jgi:hypothetical protein